MHGDLKPLSRPRLQNGHCTSGRNGSLAGMVLICILAEGISLMISLHLASLILLSLAISSCLVCSLGRLLAILYQVIVLLACVSDITGETT